MSLKAKKERERKRKSCNLPPCECAFFIHAYITGLVFSVSLVAFKFSPPPSSRLSLATMEPDELSAVAF